MSVSAAIIATRGNIQAGDVVGDEQRCADQLGEVEHNGNDQSPSAEPGHASTATDGLDVPV
jgi:hypothetical protein